MSSFSSFLNILTKYKPYKNHCKIIFTMKKQQQQKNIPRKAANNIKNKNKTKTQNIYKKRST